MNYEIIMKSDHMLFIKPSFDLVDDYLTMVNDIENQRFISKRVKKYSRKGEIKWVKEKLENGLVFTILEKETEKFVGNIEFMDYEGTSAELGACLTKDMQDKHYGTEAETKMIEYAFEVLHLECLRAGVFDYNKRSLHCAKKVGFKELARKKQTGEFGVFEEILLKIDREDYALNNNISLSDNNTHKL